MTADTIVITDPAGPVTIRIEESPITVQIEEETVTVTPGGDEEIIVTVDDEKTTILTVFELANPPTGPAGGDLTGYYPAPILKPNGVIPGTYSSVTVGSDGRITSGSNAGAGGSAYIHTQSAPASTWTIAHNLNRYPSVTVVDSANSVVIGNVTYLDTNNLVVTFSAPFSGYAYLN
jgi:hypothetical protein